MYKDDNLAACMALITYEVAECPDKIFMACATHMKGCAKLIELRGPDAYFSDFSHELFVSFCVIGVGRFLLGPRSNMFLTPCLKIQQAFAERRHTFLSGSEWIHLPFKDRPKRVFHQLLDVAAIVPDIIADGYRMLQGPVEGTVTFDLFHCIHQFLH